MSKTLQLCWDCAKACCGCSLSLTGTPIPGWTATSTVDANGVESYCIKACPLFERDAYEFGTSRTPPLTEEERRAKYRERQRIASRNKYRRVKERKVSAGWAEAALNHVGGAK